MVPGLLCIWVLFSFLLEEKRREENLKGKVGSRDGICKFRGQEEGH